MRLLFFILLFMLVSALEVNAQKKSEYYCYENDTTYNVNLTLKYNNAFIYNFKERGYCHYCYFTTRKGTWSQKDDTIILLYTYSNELKVNPLIASFDSLQKNIIISVRSERGEALTGVKVIAKYGEPEHVKEFITDINGNTVILKDSIEIIPGINSKDSLIALWFEYKTLDGQLKSDFTLFQAGYNVISFRIYLSPAFVTEAQRIYYIKSTEGLTHIQPQNTTDLIGYWENMKLCKSQSCIHID